MRRRDLLGYAGQLAGLHALASVATSAHAQSAGVSDNRILLGQSAPFSGAAEQLGLQFHLGAQLFFEATLLSESVTTLSVVAVVAVLIAALRRLRAAPPWRPDAA